MIKTAFITEDMYQQISSLWTAKQSLISKYGYIEDNPVIKKQETIFVSSIASSQYQIEYSIKSNLKESIHRFNSLVSAHNIPQLSYSENEFPLPEQIDSIVENLGMVTNRRSILAEAGNLKKLLVMNEKITDIVSTFLSTIEIESVIELVLKEMYFIGASFWYINTKKQFALEHIDFSMIKPHFKKSGVLYELTGWDIQSQGNTLKSLKLEDVLVFNNMTPIEYPGHGVIESVYGLTASLDDDLTDLRLQRATRAGVKLFHHPDLQSIGRKTPLTLDEMKEYKKFNKLNRNTVKTDYYSNGVWKIDVLKADDTIDNINDVNLTKEILEMGLIIPHGLIDSGTSVNRNTLDAQIAYYVTVAHSVAADISNKLTYLVQNYLSNSLVTKNNVKIKWNYTEPQSLLDKAKMMAYLKNQFIQMPMYKLVTDVMKWDWDSFLTAVKKDEEYINIYNSLPDTKQQIQAPKSAVDPNNTNNNITKNSNEGGSK